MTEPTATAHTRTAAEAAARETAVASMFVLLADTLVSDYDVLDVFDHLAATCVSILDVAAAGMLLDDLAGGVAVAAASSHDLRVLEVFQAQNNEGPCRDCVRKGEPVSSADLQVEQRWPLFVPVALDAGFRSISALPLRLRGETIGALGLFSLTASKFDEADERLAQAFADAATIGLVHHRSELRHTVLAEQLKSALDSRVVVEQAKGVIAERGSISMEQAFQQLRRHARNHNLKITQVALAVVEGRLRLPR